MRLIPFEGQTYEFPDDVTDDEVANALTEFTKPPEWGKVLEQVGPETRRQLAGTVAGVVKAGADVGLLSPERGEEALGARREIAAERKAEIPPRMTLPQEGVLSGLSSALLMAPAAVVAPAAALAGVGRAALIGGVTTPMGLTTGFEKYGESREYGLDPSRSALHGLLHGLIEKYTEYLPLREFDFVKGKLVGSFYKFLGKEMLGEQVATALQDLNDKISTKPNMTLGEWAHDAAVTAISVAISGPLQAGATRVTAAAMAPFIKPELLTPEQKIVLDTAAQAAGVPPPTVPLPLPTGETVSVPAETLGAVPPLPQAKVVDVLDLALPDKHPAVENGKVRLYTVVPLTPTLPETLVWTPSLAKVQEIVDVIGPMSRIPYVDVTPDEAQAAQETEEVRKIRTEQQVAQEQEYVLPTSLITSGQYLYNPPAATEVPTPAPTPAPVAKPITDTALTWLYRHDNGKVRITFPDAESKALALYANHVDGATTIISQEQLATERQQLAQAYGVSEDKVAEIAKAYRDEIVDTARSIKSGSIQPHKFNLAEHERWKQRNDLPAVKMRRELASRVVAGEVSVASGVKLTPHVKKMQAYLQKWLGMFAPTTKLAISDVSLGEQGASYRMQDGVGFITAPSEETDSFWAVFSLAHEFGHHLFTSVAMRVEHAEAMVLLRAEHETLVEQVENMSAGEFVKRWMAPNRVAYTDWVLDRFNVDARSPALELVAQVDAARPEGADGILGFDEYAAEQFARYVGHQHEQTLGGKVLEMFREAVKAVEDFFTKVVKKIAPQEQFAKWVDNLRAVPPGPVVDENERLNYLSTDAYFDLTDAQMALTTRVLSRLPKKQKVQRITVLGELSRQDVKGQERTLFNNVLDTFDGDVIDRTQLVERVLEKLVPLESYVGAEGLSWANYGLSNIGVMARDVSAHTQLFRLPFEVSTANHFHDAKYFGHARWFDHREYDKITDERVKTTRSIVELQSDLVQKEGVGEVTSTQLVGAEQRLTWAQDTVNSINNALAVVRSGHMNDRGHVIDDSTLPEREFLPLSHVLIPYALNVIRGGQTSTSVLKEYFKEQVRWTVGLVSWIDPQMTDSIVNALQASLETAQVRVEERRVDLRRLQERLTLNIPNRIKTLPDRWWEFMLRKLNSEAARDGVKVMRMATADTVAKVEGWLTRRREILKIAQPNHTDYNRWFIAEDSGGLPEGTKTYKTYNEALVVLNSMPPSYGRQQGIYNRYANEITKFVKREFGAKEVLEPKPSGSIAVNDKGVSWLEWTVQPNLAGVPVEYYDLTDSLANAGENTARGLQNVVGDDVPQLPAYFERFQGFFELGLKLSQTAKILPHVQQLQRYRRLTEQEANLKNQLLSSTNDRLKEWYKLNKTDSLGVISLLRDEEATGKHWTKLTQHSVTLNGQPAVMWLHDGTPEVVTEAQKRGLSEKAVSVYISVKNDFLTDLGVMEQTVLRSIDHFYRNNPIAGSARKGIVQRQFQQWREVPYVPDRRYGQWSVVVKNKEEQTIDGKLIKKNEVIYFSRHETQVSQKQEFAALKKQYGSQFSVTMDYVEDRQYVLRSLPRAFIESLPEALGLTPEQLTKFDELYYDLTKEGSYLKMLGRGKKRTLGAEQDLRRAYADQRWRTANLIAKMTYGYQLQGQLRSLNSSITNVANNGGSVVALRRLHEWLNQHYEYVHTPQHEFEQLRAFVSLWYLWGAPKTALMNATTMMTTTYPRLASQFGDVKATAAILRAMKDVVTTWKHPDKLGPEIAKVIVQAKADGSINQSFAAEAAAVADGYAIERVLPSYSLLHNTAVKDRARKYTWNLVHWGMLPFRVAEEFNRRATLVAAYRLEKASGKKGVFESTGEGSAYLAARDTISYTQNEYAPWDRARFLMGKQSVFLIFQSFVQHMAFFMFGGDKGWWRGWLVLAALGGLQGLPGAENALDFLNWLARKMDPNDYTDLRVEARKVAQGLGLNPDMAMHGASHSMFGLGWDTSASMSLGRIIPGTEAVFGQGDATRRLMQLSSEVGGPFGALTVNVLQALLDDNPSMLLSFERALPPVVRSIERGYRGATDSRWTDAKGRALVDETTGVEVLGQLMGFSPTRKTEVQELLHLQHEAAQFYTLRRQNLLTALWQAKDAKDSDAESVVREAIQRYNSDVPDAQLRITAQEIQQSMRARERQSRETSTGVSAIRRYRSLYEGVAASFPEAR